MATEVAFRATLVFSSGHGDAVGNELQTHFRVIIRRVDDRRGMQDIGDRNRGWNIITILLSALPIINYQTYNMILTHHQQGQSHLSIIVGPSNLFIILESIQKAASNGPNILIKNINVFVQS
jgi:hypothetical protein